MRDARRRVERESAERRRVIVTRANLFASIHHQRETINIYLINVNNSRASAGGSPRER